MQFDEGTNDSPDGGFLQKADTMLADDLPEVEDFPDDALVKVSSNAMTRSMVENMGDGLVGDQ